MGSNLRPIMVLEKIMLAAIITLSVELKPIDKAIRYEIPARIIEAANVIKVVSLISASSLLGLRFNPNKNNKNMMPMSDTC